MSRLLLVEQDDDGPLCPNDDPRHRLVVKMLDAMYEVMDRDQETGESPPDQERLYRAASKAGSSSMQLYVVSSIPSITGLGSDYARLGVNVEGWYFRCSTCEFMIPALGIRRL